MKIVEPMFSNVELAFIAAAFSAAQAEGWPTLCYLPSLNDFGLVSLESRNAFARRLLEKLQECGASHSP